MFAKSPESTAQRKSHTDANTFLCPYAATEFSVANAPYGDVYALKTTSGNALVITSSMHSQFEHVICLGGYITVGPHAEERAWVHSTSAQVLTTTYTCLDAAAVPLRGKVDLFGSDCETTGTN